jgi:hypothetical protein
VSVGSTLKLGQKTEQDGRGGWQLRKKKYVKIRGSGRRLGGPQSGSGAFEKGEIY